jgi:ligand-binding SRPBCC domain-containing protein
MSTGRRIHLLEREQVVSLRRECAFQFFADPGNLQSITPPWLRFRLLVPPPPRVEAGTLIAYRLELHRIPCTWLTAIEAWEPPRRFVDVQLQGPFAVWEHTHELAEDAAGTVIHDRVLYSHKLGPLGELAERAFVRRDLERIFDFRAAVVGRALEEPG